METLELGGQSAIRLRGEAPEGPLFKQQQQPVHARRNRLLQIPDFRTSHKRRTSAQVFRRSPWISWKGAGAVGVCRGAARVYIQPAVRRTPSGTLATSAPRRVSIEFEEMWPGKRNKVVAKNGTHSPQEGGACRGVGCRHTEEEVQ
ncbi:hypothetical protein cyc_02759 [Cyclospora cayetanensis]|uniref:Uncharacterized protein n=1 Tax=Cyclospora cayetanensis TaxID=88456 RepID=A0A1D3CWY2_9EIME|nr:hypothetical protein cyc_02759 [Cyclospora cayetanensis]